MARPASELVIAPLALDPLAAALARQVGFDTIYVGGGGLGYLRGVSEALLTATEVAEVVRQITEVVDVHVVVDGTTGFGDAVHTHRTMRLFEQAGAVAIEIEDQVSPKRAHHQKGVEHLVSVEDMAGKIKTAVDARTDPDFLVIARTNAFKRGEAEEAAERCAAYEEAGADMVLPLPWHEGDLALATEHTTVPLVGMMPTGRSAEELVAAGYALVCDALSATLLTYRALRGGYEALMAGEEYGESMDSVLAELAQVGATIGIERLFEIEARTSERALYADGDA
jgi:methylisocitrate lyase